MPDPTTDLPSAVLIAVQLPGVSDAELKSELEELARLVKTLGLETSAVLTQRRSSLGAAAVLGRGKLVELARFTGGTGVVPKGAKAPNTKARARSDEEAPDETEPEVESDSEESDAANAPARKATMVVVDHEITPSQARNLAERLEPSYTGWQAHERPFAFEEAMEYAQGAARFLTGTPNVPAHYAATAGYDLIEEIGVERIRENSLRQTQLLIDLADEAGFEVRSPREPARRGGTVTVQVPEFAAVHHELTERQILCDFRPDAGIRLGPHYYNSADEIRFVIEQIADVLETGAFERHVGVVARH